MALMLVALMKVRRFWQIGHPEKVKWSPGFPEADTRELQLKLLEEEIKELSDASRENDLVEFADAIADVLYVTIGMAVTHGLPLEEIFEEVHRTNMAKFVNGKPLLRESDGKIMKPEGWTPPDIAGIIRRWS
jgi:predicted HAD superfamily Cof-like phosphohydrolase